MKKIMITLAVMAAFAVPAAAHVDYRYFEDLNYTSIVYGDHVELGDPEPDHGLVVAHNRGVLGFAGTFGTSPEGDQFLRAGLLPQQEVTPTTLTGYVYISVSDDLYKQASGTAAGMVLGSFKPARYPDGTPMYLNMSVTPNLSGDMPDYENYYFKLYNDGGLLTELNAGKMTDTVYVTAGERLNFEMYALVDDQVANASYTRRDFQFTTIQGGPVSVVPLPGSMLLGGIGTSIISIFGRANRRRQRA